jgi:hypothetical protein
MKEKSTGITSRHTLRSAVGIGNTPGCAISTDIFGEGRGQQLKKTFPASPTTSPASQPVKKLDGIGRSLLPQALGARRTENILLCEVTDRAPVPCAPAAFIPLSTHFVACCHFYHRGVPCEPRKRQEEMQMRYGAGASLVAQCAFLFPGAGAWWWVSGLWPEWGPPGGPRQPSARFP